MTSIVGHPQAMLSDIYLEALLVDEELADQVWDAWDSGLASNEVDFLAWVLIAGVSGQL